jgi:hypothetical protein
MNEFSMILFTTSSEEICMIARSAENPPIGLCQLPIIIVKLLLDFLLTLLSCCLVSGAKATRIIRCGFRNAVSIILSIVSANAESTDVYEEFDDPAVSAIGKVNQRWSVIGWVTKNLLSRAPLCFGRHVKPLVPAEFAVVSTHQSTLGPRGGLQVVISKEGLRPRSGDINRLMMRNECICVKNLIIFASLGA